MEILSNENYLSEQRLYIIWLLSIMGSNQLALMVYKNKEIDGFDVEVFLDDLNYCLALFKSHNKLNLIEGFTDESSELNVDRFKRTNYFCLGEEAYKEAIKNKYYYIDDLLKLDFYREDFQSLSFLDLFKISWHVSVQEKARNFLRSYLGLFIRDDLESTLGDARYLGAENSLRDLFDTVENKVGKLLPKNIKIRANDIAEMVVRRDFIDDPTYNNSSVYESMISDYLKSFKYLETLLSSELLGYLRVRFISNDGSTVVDRGDVITSANNYEKIRLTTDKKLGSKVEENNQCIIEKEIGYLVFNDEKIKIGPSKNVPFKLLQALCPLGKPKAINAIFNLSTTSRSKLKNENANFSAKKKVLTQRIKELQEILPKKKIKVSIVFNDTDETVFLETNNKR